MSKFKIFKIESIEIFSMIIMFLSISTDPKWYPARQSLHLDPSVSWFFLTINSAFVQLSWSIGVVMKLHDVVWSYCGWWLWAVTFLRIKVSQGWGSAADTSRGNHSQLLLQRPRTAAHMGNRESTCAQTHNIKGHMVVLHVFVNWRHAMHALHHCKLFPKVYYTMCF